MKDQASSYATSVVGTAVLGAAFLSLTWPRWLVAAAGWIDSTWSVAEIRADKAAKELAHALALRLHGHRPVTLVGFGMGARLIFKCLLYLSELGPRGHGLVETAVCMGTPLPASPKEWYRAQAMCGYRLVNVYSRSDWVLAFLYRSSSFSRYVAGLQVVEHLDTNTVLENVDVTALVTNHWEYRDKLHVLLQVFRRVGVGAGVGGRVVACACACGWMCEPLRAGWGCGIESELHVLRLAALSTPLPGSPHPYPPSSQVIGISSGFTDLDALRETEKDAPAAESIGSDKETQPTDTPPTVASAQGPAASDASAISNSSPGARTSAAATSAGTRHAVPYGLFVARAPTDPCPLGTPPS